MNVTGLLGMEVVKGFLENTILRLKILKDPLDLVALAQIERRRDIKARRTNLPRKKRNNRYWKHNKKLVLNGMYSLGILSSSFHSKDSHMEPSQKLS